MQNIDLLKILEPNQMCMVHISPKVATELQGCKGTIIRTIELASKTTYFIVGTACKLIDLAENWNEIGHINLRWGNVYRMHIRDGVLCITRYKDTYEALLEFDVGGI